MKIEISRRLNSRFSCALLLFAAPVALLSGCASGRNAAAGTAIGTGLGALTGAIIGGGSGHAAGGALIGAATGAMAGNLMGETEDAREERDAAIAQVNYERAQMQAQAMCNADLVMMTHNGISDDVIVTAVNSRGGNFDLSPSAIIQLKNSGVSDRVILATQSARRAGPVLPPPNVVYAVPQPDVVLVRPRPSVGVYFGSGPPPRHHHW